MTTADLRWTPARSVSSTPLEDLVSEDSYIGRHRKQGTTRALSMMRMMYRPRHRAR